MGGGLIIGSILGLASKDTLHEVGRTIADAIPDTAQPDKRIADLYRAVNPAELEDIVSHGGAFRNPPGIERKHFSTAPGGAISYAQQTYGTGLYQGPYTLVGTQIPTNLITPDMRANVDRGIDTVTVPTHLLPALSPAKIIGPIPVP